MTRRRRAYNAYLESSHWKNLSRLTKERDNYECKQCGRTRWLVVHHRRYRKNLRDCTINDLVTLCDPCHKTLHRERARQRKLKRRARRAEMATVSEENRHLAYLIFYYDAK